MKERVEQLVGPRANAMWVMTFHSACVRILRRESKKLGFTSSFSIYDAADSKRLMALVCRDLDLDPKRFPPKSFSAEDLEPEERADRRGDLRRPGRRRLREDARPGLRDVPVAAARGQRAGLRRHHHDDGPSAPGVPGRRRALPPPLPARPGRRVPGHQPRAVHARTRAGGPRRTRADAPAELCVVGDADQSIYAFRGATIRNILQFEEDYPNATTILLEQNYRSTQTILSAANAVIERNESRRPKNLWTNAGAGARITGYVADTEHDEAQFVADEIDRLTDAGDAKAGDVAIFYRTNAQSRVFEEIFIRVGLPYKVVGGVRFYERKEVRDVLAYLRVLANPEDTVPLRRILNVPKRGIGDRAEAMIDALVAAREDHLPAGAAPRRRGVRHGGPLDQRRQAVQHADGGAAHDRRVGRGPGDGPGGGPGADRLSRGAAGVHRPAGRDPHREPSGTRRRGAGVRAGARGGRRRGRRECGHARRIPGAGRARRRLRPDPRRGRRTAPASSR